MDKPEAAVMSGDGAQRQWISWKLGLNSEVSPSRRVKPFLLYGVPVLNVLAIAALVALTAGRIAVSPSVRFNLPELEFFSGAQTTLSAALVVPPDSRPILFFDGIRYRLDDDAEAAALSDAISRAAGETGEKEISLFADATAPHGQIMRFAAAAKSAGASAVNVAIREAAAK